MQSNLDIVIIGLTITSSWGNGHATTYRSLVRALTERGNNVLFLERDVPWYAENRDLPHPPYGRTALYSSVEELKSKYDSAVRSADVCIVGSYVPDGVRVGEWAIETAEGISAFYDIDTPVTLANLERGSSDYITPKLISQYDLYLSFTGGPTLDLLEEKYGSPAARPLYCSVDPTLYYPIESRKKWDLGYMGTYSPDRQPTLERLLIEPARVDSRLKTVVAGAQFPPEIEWLPNVERLEHIPPPDHCAFYNAQKYTLNVTRADMIEAGFSPSVRLFEAAACAVPVISDYWTGLDEFFKIGEEILVAFTTEDVLRILETTSEEKRREIGNRARVRVLAEHTSRHRAVQLENYVKEQMKKHGSRRNENALEMISQ